MVLARNYPHFCRYHKQMQLAQLDIPKLLTQHRWPWHLGFWFMYGVSRSIAYFETMVYYPPRVLHSMLLLELPVVVVVYATLWVYRNLMRKNRVYLYAFIAFMLWLVALFVFAHGTIWLMGHMKHLEGYGWQDLFKWNTIRFFFTFLCLTTVKYLKDGFMEQYRTSERRKLQVESELQNLKAQVSPHFLFNTMHNFYGLAVEKSEKLPILMVRLADLLRYSLYETQSAFVPLNREIAYLEDYIELEKIRLEDSLRFRFDKHGDATENWQIAPLILVVFLENAFKHAKNADQALIDISVKTHLSEHGVFSFEVRNNCTVTQTAQAAQVGGIGLENVRKRLSAIYPGGLYTLLIHTNEGVFQVNLTIQLKVQQNAHV
jgi:Histidine kinase/GHKL domain